MATLVIDPDVEAALIAERVAAGVDGFDEVWEGTYVMSPLADDQHQGLQAKLLAIFLAVIDAKGRGKVRAGVNISDRDKDWKQNFRVPEIAVFLSATKAKCRGTHWVGGPDLAVEITSPGDRSREKIPFYCAVGVQEYLIVDRDRWSLDLHRWTEGELLLIGSSTVENPSLLSSNMLPLTFRMRGDGTSPQIEVASVEDAQQWVISVWDV